MWLTFFFTKCLVSTRTLLNDNRINIQFYTTIIRFATTIDQGSSPCLHRARTLRIDRGSNSFSLFIEAYLQAPSSHNIMLIQEANPLKHMILC